MNTIAKYINEAKCIYLIGIGGIGMSAIARYFLSLGKKVSGYDRTETAITKQLQQEGIDIHYSEDVALIPTNPDYVVYTPAIPKEHKELQYYQNNGSNVVKRSDILQIITENTFNICVAGTHGKTTISTMIAHLLRDSGYGCSAFLGGISANYNTNFWSSTNDVCVIEADEYDRSFLKLSPNIAVITAMDADHLDIYGTEENVKDAFRQFATRIKPKGVLIKKWGLDRTMQATHTLSYSLQNDTADTYAANIVLKNGGYLFDAVLNNKVIAGIRLNMGGMHNVENIMAAITAANSLEIEEERIKTAVASFKGVKRRFEYVIKQQNLVFIDDYAHHPEELKALINGAKSLFPDMRCTLIFQPHLYTRTRDFALEFAEVLGTVDRVTLLPIYPARELPIDGVTSEMILNTIHTNASKVLYTKEQLLDWIEHDFAKNREKEFGEVLITAGAGDIDKLVELIKHIIEVQ